MIGIGDVREEISQNDPLHCLLHSENPAWPLVQREEAREGDQDDLLDSLLTGEVLAGLLDQNGEDLSDYLNSGRN